VGRHDLALADFSRAIELAPGAKEPRANRALTYAELGRYEEALADINTAIEHDPEAAWVYQARAGVLASQGHKPEALADFDRALELEPMLATALVGRAMLYIDLEQLPEACNDLRRAIEINPGDPEPYVLIASVFFSLDDYREVRRYFNMLAQRADPSAMRRFADEATKRRSRPKDASAWNFEGMLLSSLGEHQEAIAAFDQAHAAAPEVADLLVNLGFALARAGRSDEALQHYDRALELNANSESAWHNKGSWLRDHGRYREAIECFDQALASDPTHEASQQGRAQALRLLRRAAAGPSAPAAAPAKLTCPRCIRPFEVQGIDRMRRFMHAVRAQCPSCGARLLIDLETGQIVEINPS
jgi:tetratricopeptide (TPR) repeat protein